MPPAVANAYSPFTSRSEPPATASLFGSTLIGAAADRRSRVLVRRDTVTGRGAWTGVDAGTPRTGHMDWLRLAAPPASRIAVRVGVEAEPEGYEEFTEAFFRFLSAVEEDPLTSPAGSRFAPSGVSSASAATSGESDVLLSEEERRLLDYLTGLVASRLIAPSTRQRALALWARLQGLASSRLAVPDAGPTEDGGVIIAFDDGRSHLEAEIRPDGEVEAFFLDRSTDTMGDWDYPSVDEVDDALLEKLLIFSA